MRAERPARTRLDAGNARAQVVARPRLALRPAFHEGVAVDSVRLCCLDAGPAPAKPVCLGRLKLKFLQAFSACLTLHLARMRVCIKLYKSTPANFLMRRCEASGGTPAQCTETSSTSWERPPSRAWSWAAATGAREGCGVRCAGSGGAVTVALPKMLMAGRRMDCDARESMVMAEPAGGPLPLGRAVSHDLTCHTSCSASAEYRLATHSRMPYTASYSEYVAPAWVKLSSSGIDSMLRCRASQDYDNQLCMTQAR